MLYVKKPIPIEAITFDEFVQYGRDNCQNIVNGMPWAFEYKGFPITHENDECYLIPTSEGTMHFTPLDMLLTGVGGEIYPCKIEIFKATYDLVEKPEIVCTDEEAEEGWKIKYNVYKVEDGSPVFGCFVLRPDKDPAAVQALITYASYTPSMKLGTDIHAWLRDLAAGKQID